MHEPLTSPPHPSTPALSEAGPAETFDLAVIGGGAAGTMGMLRAVLYRLRVAHFQGDSDTRRRARAPWVAGVDTIPGLHDLGHPLSQQLLATQTWIEAQEHLRSQLTPLKVAVEHIEPLEGAFRIHWTERRRRSPTGSPRSLLARAVLLATGQSEEQPHVQGSIEPIFPFANARQVLYSLRSDGHRALGHRTAVLGHTERAAQVALLLHERYAPPWLGLLTHGQALSCLSETQARLEEAGIPIVTSAVVAFEGSARHEGLTGAVLEDGARVALTRIFVALPRRVYHALGSRLGIRADDEGYLETDAYGETVIPGLFVAGDLRAGSRQQITAAWEEANVAVERIEARLREARRSQPR